MIIKTLKEWCEKVPTFLANKEERFCFIEHTETEVAYGWDEDFDKEYCDTHNIPYHSQIRDGGTIVCAKGNIGIGYIYPNSKYGCFILVKLLDDFSEWLRSKGLTVERSRNDVLVDGYKVASGCGYNLEPNFKMTYEGTQISVNQDFEVIKNVCKKPMIKVPKGLSDFGITTEEVKEWCKSWLSENIGMEA